MPLQSVQILRNMSLINQFDELEARKIELSLKPSLHVEVLVACTHQRVDLRPPLFEGRGQMPKVHRIYGCTQGSTALCAPQISCEQINLLSNFEVIELIWITGHKDKLLFVANLRKNAGHLLQAFRIRMSELVIEKYRYYLI